MTRAGTKSRTRGRWFSFFRKEENEMLDTLFWWVGAIVCHCLSFSLGIMAGEATWTAIVAASLVRFVYAESKSRENLKQNAYLKMPIAFFSAWKNLLGNLHQKHYLEAPNGWWKGVGNWKVYYNRDARTIAGLKNNEKKA